MKALACIAGTVWFGLAYLAVPLVGVSCQEDMACWDCYTMGNKICGKVV